jgi:2-amino-4-hydroxy-6-hydroxymethyldihydropteridine diphosphokinase
MIFVGLGSNMGERIKYLTEGIDFLIRHHVRIVQISPVYETQAWGYEAQADFLNAIIQIDFSSTSYELLSLLQGAEQACGRKREIHWGPRTLDMDLLCFHDELRDDSDLRLPHPAIAERAFVLAPWKDIAPDFILPHWHQSVSALWQVLAEAEKKSVVLTKHKLT